MNTFMCVGVINREPDYRMTQKGDAMLKLSVRVAGNKKSEDNKYISNYFDFTAWGKTAIFIQEWFRKDMPIAIQATIQNYKYEKEGVTIYGNNFIINSVSFVPESRIDEDSKNTNNNFS